MKYLRKVSSHLSMAAAVTVCALNIGVAAAKVPAVITWAVPPEGASGYLMVTGFSGTVTKHTPVRKIVLQNFAGVAGWPTRMQRGELNFAIHCGFKTMSDAWQGKGIFEKIGRMKNIRNVATGYGLAYGYHFSDAKIKSVGDMKGKSLFLQVRHHDQVTAATVMLADFGLIYDKDVKIIPVRSPREAIQGILTGRGDGMAYGAVPGLAQVKQAKSGFHTVSIPMKTLNKISAAEPVWGATTLKAGSNPLKPAKDVSTLELGCGISAGTATSADTVYQVIKAVYDHHDDWKSVHPIAKRWSIKKAVQTTVQPFHDGAIRYYKEKGVWTAALEAKQKALLAE